MGSSSQRPTNLDITTISLPITAVASILHRLSGLFLFISLPFLLWLLGSSLQSATAFAHAQTILSGFIAKFLIWLVMAAATYHTLAGIRHLFMDLGCGEELATARFLAQAVLVLAVVVSLGLGVWLWW